MCVALEILGVVVGINLPSIIEGCCWRCYMAYLMIRKKVVCQLKNNDISCSKNSKEYLGHFLPPAMTQKSELVGL